MTFRSWNHAWGITVYAYDQGYAFLCSVMPIFLKFLEIRKSENMAEISENFQRSKNMEILSKISEIHKLINESS